MNRFDFLKLIPAFLFAGATVVACTGNTPESANDSTDPLNGKQGGKCFDSFLGGPSSCKPADVWKKYAADECAKQGADLVSYFPDGACGQGDFMATKYTCCIAPPPPPPPPPACTDDIVGSPNQGCNDDSLLKQKAAGSCQIQGKVLTQISYAEDCKQKGFSSYAKYECCDAQPPPPPPPACTNDVVGSPNQGCNDDSLLKQKAAGSCQIQGKVLTQIAYAEDCKQQGFSSYAKYECCDAQPPPPPPPPVCIGDIVGSPNQGCNDDSLLKQKAAGSCQSQGKVLTQIAYADDCKQPGFSSYAKYECCDAPPPPPPVCTDNVVGTPNQGCNDDALLKLKADGSCKAAGLVLTQINYAEDCKQQGFSSYAKYECCAP